MAASDEKERTEIVSSSQQLYLWKPIETPKKKLSVNCYKDLLDLIM